jgi:hypothetical protein
VVASLVRAATGKQAARANSAMLLAKLDAAQRQANLYAQFESLKRPRQSGGTQAKNVWRGQSTASDVGDASETCCGGIT